MSIKKIGKLKLDLSGNGLSFRWGDGKVHSIGKSEADTDALYEESPYEENEGAGYDDGYDTPDKYDDEPYDDRYDGEAYDDADDGYDDGQYEDDDRYDDRRYDDSDDDYDDERDDDRYDDDRYDNRDDDRYDDRDDDRYDDDRYDDDRYDDDRYDDEAYDDNGDRYDDEPYDDRDASDGYDNEGEYYEDGAGAGGIMAYIDENDWVTYVLLFLFAPLGIYLLWRRRMFDDKMRWALSAGAAVWFIVLIVLLSLLIFGSSGDTSAPANLTIITSTPTAEIELVVTEPETTNTPEPVVEATEEVDISVEETAAADTGADSNLVYSVNGELYYHASQDCDQIGTATPSYVSIAEATKRGQFQCPVCYNLQTYYGKEGGTYYHTIDNCSDMKNPSEITQAVAESWGLTACPTCNATTTASGLFGTTDTTETVSSNCVFISTETQDMSGINVWYTTNGTYYHLKSNCSNMSGASQHSLKDALLGGKLACPTCCASASMTYYCTANGNYYHKTSDCSGMEGASPVTFAEIKVMGKQACPTCIGTTTSSSSTNSSSSGQMVYATEGGQYYHSNSTCSGMKNAKQYALSDMIAAGREACPTCCSGANDTVYCTANGTYYHSYATCSDMQNAVTTTRAQALAAGKKQCPKCWSSTKTTSSTTSKSSSSSKLKNLTANSIYVYATSTGTYYHTVKNCSGMKNAKRGKLYNAVRYGLKACPVCASAANSLVYSTDGGKYYHSLSDCGDMKGAVRRTLQDALMLGQKACPDCYGKAVVTADEATTTDAAASQTYSSITGTTTTGTSTVGVPATETYTSGKSGVYVYATLEGTYYHSKSDCSGMKSAVHISLETAMNYGKSPCPTCCSSASATVYATSKGKYYHKSASCAGSGAISGTLAKALAMGYKACPTCVSGTTSSSTSGNLITASSTSSNTYKAGTSGVNVYAKTDGKYYHKDSTCAGGGASVVSLETALNYGKTACPTCCSTAARTVYAVPGGTYYHTNKSCAGSNAVSGTYAVALASGYKACPVCIGGNASADKNTADEYTASANTTVYVDLNSESYYYHKSATCEKAGMTNGTAAKLEYALEWNYTRCPYCKPASGISSGTDV